MLEWIISSSVLIVVVIALRFVLKGKLSLRLQYALWALVLVRLLIPFSFGSSSISVMNSVEQSTVYQTTSQVVTTVQVPSDIIRDSELTIEEAEQVGHGTLHRVEGYPAESGRENLHTYSFQDSLKEVGSRILCGYWICGIVVMGSWFAFSNLRLLYGLKKNRTLLKHSGNLPVYLSDLVDTPCLFGFFCPAIYLTSESAADETVSRHVVEHELTHYRHRDHIWSILRCVCLAVHWYNPLVWCAAILSRNDAELACDETTIRRLGESERAAYGRTLIGLTCQKRTALLNTATTMTGSGKSIKERIALIVKKPKMAVYTLIAVLIIAAIAVGCTFTGAKDPSDSSKDSSDTSEEQTEGIGTETPPPAEEQRNLFADMEDYVHHRMEQKKTVSYYSAATQDEVTVDVLDARIAWLEKRGEVFGLAPDGTLEAWSYNILVKPDADPEDIMLVGGQYDEDGYFDLEGQGGRITVALRDTNGNYDILYDAVINDGLDFFGYCNTTDEAIHDWYVKQYDLDLPLYATEWIDRITLPEGANLGNYPVHRYDGDGWYIYVPVQTWICPKESEAQIFRSAYYTGSTLKVDYFDYAPEGLSDDHRKQGFTLIEETNLIWSRSSGGISTWYYCFDAQDGGCWRVAIEWIDANITDYPYIAMEPDILHLMAKSFTVYGAKAVTTLPVLELSREDYNAVCDAVLNHLRTGWWTGIPMADCAYESSAFECVYRETKDEYTDWFYGYGGYFGFNETGDCVEYWYAPCIVTMDSETKQVYQVWWPGDGAYYEMDILEHFPDEIAEFVAEPNEERYQIILDRLMESGKARMESTATYGMSRCLSSLTQEQQNRFDRNEESLSILRVDENRERALTVDGNMLSVLSSAANTLQQIGRPDDFRALGGGVYVWFDSTRHLAFFAGEEPFTVLLRYVADDANESAAVNDPQLYLYLVASAERENVQLVDLDDDEFLEAILWQYSENNLIIYDYYGNEIHRIDTNQTIGCDASDYTGLIANIKPEYSHMIQAQNSDGTVSVYHYKDGSFSYECPISEVLNSVN